jgi:uncharacterized membrane protein (DUF2068 family)
VDWSLLSCSRNGHLTFAPDEPELRAQLGATLPGGTAWRCLRCGTFVPGPVTRSGPAATAPVVPRGPEIRSKLILRLFAVERYLRALLFGALAFALWRFVANRASIEAALNRDMPVVRDIFGDLGVDVRHSTIYGLVEHALTLSAGTAMLLAIAVTGYAAIEVVEGTGLWLARRWGEYFAMIATSLGLPLEIYDLTRKLSALALVLLGVNLALVLYLIITKRLFGVRGGKQAYDARLRSESVLAQAQRLAAQRPIACRPASASAPGPGPATAVAQPPADRAAAPATPAASADQG